jgi:hypothetical protein
MEFSTSVAAAAAGRARGRLFVDYHSLLVEVFHDVVLISR